VPHATTSARVSASAREGDVVEVGGTSGTTRVVTTIPLEAGETTTVTMRVRRTGSTAVATYTLGLTRGTASDEAPTNVRAVSDAGRAWLTLTPPAVTDLENYEVRVDDGPWTAFFPARTEAPLRLDGLVDGTTYTVRVRGVTAQGETASSAPVRVTPRAPDDSPVTLTFDAAGAVEGGWTVEGPAATRTITLEVRNDDAAVLDSVWLHVDVPGAIVRDVVPGPTANGDITKLGDAWHWRNAGLPAGEGASVVLTLESEVR